MDRPQSKQEIRQEIEKARKLFYSAGRRVQRLAPGEEEAARAVKPRKQRLKMFA